MRLAPLLTSLALVAVQPALPGCGRASDGGTAAAGERELTGAEIQQLFSGKTVVGHHAIHGYDFESYYEPGGTYRSHQTGKSGARKGRWWVEGNDICVHWEDETPPGDLCRRMVLDSAGKYRKVIAGSGKLVVRFESFTPGNAKNL